MGSVLAVGDSFVPATVFADVLTRMKLFDDCDLITMDESARFHPETESDRRLREVAGTPDQIIAALMDHEAILVHGAPITAEILDAAPSLAFIGIARGGPVNVDITAAAERSIPVAIAPGKNAPAVAEIAIAMAIAISRRMPSAMSHVASGGEIGVYNFEGAAWLGAELTGKTFGLLGFGKVGIEVAKRIAGFGVQMVAYDPYADPATFDAHTVESVSLDQLLDRSDILSIHARLTDQTAGIVGVDQIARMRRGALIVNTARAELLDLDAAGDAIVAGHLGGLAADVVPPYRGGSPHPLLESGNVLLTPHIGGATAETLTRGVEMITQDWVRFKEGKTPLHAVGT